MNGDSTKWLFCPHSKKIDRGLSVFQIEVPTLKNLSADFSKQNQIKMKTIAIGIK